MSLKNTFVYMQFHPLAYIVKLKIEMSMADLIATVAKRQNPQENNNRPSDNTFQAEKAVMSSDMRDAEAATKASPFTIENDADDGVSMESQKISKGPTGVVSQRELRGSAEDLGHYASQSVANGMGVHTMREVRIEVENVQSVKEEGGSTAGSFDDNGVPRKEDDDTRPLRNGTMSGKKGMGIYTKVWGP